MNILQLHSSRGRKVEKELWGFYSVMSNFIKNNDQMALQRCRRPLYRKVMSNHKTAHVVEVEKVAWSSRQLDWACPKSSKDSRLIWNNRQPRVNSPSRCISETPWVGDEQFCTFQVRLASLAFLTGAGADE